MERSMELSSTRLALFRAKRRSNARTGALASGVHFGLPLQTTTRSMSSTGKPGFQLGGRRQIEP